MLETAASRNNPRDESMEQEAKPPSFEKIEHFSNAIIILPAVLGLYQNPPRSILKASQLLEKEGAVLSHVSWDPADPPVSLVFSAICPCSSVLSDEPYLVINFTFDSGPGLKLESENLPWS